MNLGLMNRRAAQKSLPYDAEVEYLESSNGQYIDTGVIINSGDYNFIADGMIFDFSSSIATVRWTESPTYCSYGIYVGSRDVIVAYYGNYQNLNYNNTIVFSKYKNKRKIYRFGENQKFTIEDLNGTINESIPVPFDNTLQNNTYSLPLFSFFRQGNIVTSNSKVRLYSFIFKKGNEVIQDLIPVRKGTVGYMYDKISGQLFGNGGTGNFILGPDK